MILEIQNLIWLETPKGPATAKFLIDYGPEADIYWVCFLQTGEIWTFPNYEVRVSKNVTLGRSVAAVGISILEEDKNCVHCGKRGTHDINCPSFQ